MPNKRRQVISLKVGDEILLNGFVIRAIGLDNIPDSLSIYHPDVMKNTETIDASKHLFAGLCDDVIIKSQIVVGLAGALAKSNGWSGWHGKARKYIASYTGIIPCKNRHT